MLKKRRWILPLLTLSVTACAGATDLQAGQVAEDQSPSNSGSEVSRSELGDDQNADRRAEFDSQSALALYEDSEESLERYLNELLVDQEADVSGARTVLSHIDPSLLGGDFNASAEQFHQCISSQAATINQVFEVADLTVEAEHLAQHRIDDQTFALEMITVTRVRDTLLDAGSPRVVLVTRDGLGPDLTPLPYGTCEAPWSTAAERLADQAVMTLPIDVTSESAS